MADVTEWDYVIIYDPNKVEVGKWPVPKGTTCEMRPASKDINPSGLVTTLPDVPGFTKEYAGCSLIAPDRIGKLYFFRNVGNEGGELYNNLSLFLDAEANMKNVNIQFLGLDGTVIKTVPATKVMDAPTGGIPKPGLFVGTVKYQTLLNSDNVGKYRFIITIDGSNLTKTFNCVVDAGHPSGECAEGPGTGVVTQSDSGNQNPGSGNPGTTGGEEDQTDVEFINL